MTQILMAFLLAILLTLFTALVSLKTEKYAIQLGKMELVQKILNVLLLRKILSNISDWIERVFLRILKYFRIFLYLLILAGIIFLIYYFFF